MNWLFKDSADKTSASINGDYDFVVEQQPSASLAQTNSNLSVISYRSKTKKDALPAKVRWWKVRDGRSSELVGVRGSMYPCQPSDLGYQIKAEVHSVDEEQKGTAVVWFGPIRIESGLRQTLNNIINSGHTMFRISICSGKDFEREGIMKINETQITVIDNKSNKQLRFPYSLSQPRLQLNAKDIYRLCLRFRTENHEMNLKNFMNESFGLNISQSQFSSQNRLSDSSQLLRPTNKLQIRFLSRHSRDLVAFTMKSFATKRQMKSSAIIQRIERIDLNQQQQFKQFFEFEELKQEVIRMDQIRKQAIADRDQKMADLVQCQEEITNLTMTVNVIKDMRKTNQELNESISAMCNRNNNNTRVRDLEKQNEGLKQRIRDQCEEIQLLKFLSEKASTQKPTNPFEKKKSDQLIQSGASMKLLEEANKLKRNQKEQSNLNLHRSRSQIEIENILDTLGNKHNESSMINPSFMNQSMNESAIYRSLEENLNYHMRLSDKLLKQVDDLKSENLKNFNEVNRLKRELMSKPIDNSILPPNINSETEQQLQKLKQQHILLTRKYQQILKIGDLKSKALMETEYYQLKRAHSNCENTIRNLQYELAETEKHRGLSSSMVSSQLERYKLINSNLLGEINNLKIKLEKLNQERKQESIHTLNLKIFELESELKNLKQPSGETINKELASKLYNAEAKIKQMQEQLSLREIKIKTLDGTLERLMNQMNQKSISLDQSNITSNSMGKYKRRIKELESQNEMLRRSTNALNKSRDLSMEMDNYNSEMLDTLKQQMESILKQNQRISTMCERYAKDAKQINKIRQQNVELRDTIERMKRL